MNIIITGGTGFIGSNLIHSLLKKNMNVAVIVRKSSNLNNIKNSLKRIKVFTYNDNIDELIFFYKKFNPEITIHLATSFIAEHQSTQVKELIRSNIEFGAQILEAMKESGCKKLINAGTNWQHYLNHEYNPTCLYAATKQAFDDIIKFYVEAENFNVITLKLFDSYGENDKRPKLINLLYRFYLEGKQLELSPGEQILNLVHINDICNGFMLSINKLDKTFYKGFVQTYVLDSDKSYSLKKIILKFEEVFDIVLNIKWGKKPYRKREMMKPWSGGRRLPGWKPKISIDQGIKLLYDKKN